MSAKISDVYRQSKGRRNEPGSGKKKAAPPVYRSTEQEQEGDDSEILRQLHVFDLTSKWGPCTGAIPDNKIYAAVLTRTPEFLEG